jgi:hypothetical protein
MWRKMISWVAFLDPSDSYFLFADLVDLYTHWTYMQICRQIFLSNYWWQRSDIWSQASYWRVQTRYPQYGIPIWCLWPNIRSVSSIVAEKNATKNILDGRKDGKRFPRYGVPICSPYRGKRFWNPRIPTSPFADFVDFYTHWTYMHIFRHIFLSNYWWQRSDIWSQASMKLVTIYHISAINSCWEKCGEKWAYMFNA